MTSGNPTLDRNLNCIARYNPKLKEDLLNLPHLTNSIQLIETNLKEPNLLYNGLPLHSQDGAELEAKTTFDNTHNSLVTMHIIFGIGLGHLFKEFCERSKGKVFLYEPNLEILRVTLELVDFSKELSQKNVIVTSDMPTFKLAFASNYEYNSDVTVTMLGSYKQIYADSLQDTIKLFETVAGSCIVDYNTLKKEGFRSIDMTLDNLIYTLDGTPLAGIKDIYKGKTALIVSAGPSLDPCIETIKKNRDKVVIFCVGTAFKALASNGITPDFVNIIEINDCSGQVKGFDLSNINLITEPYTNNSIFKLNVKQKFLFPTNTAHANNYWAKLTNIDISPYISKGTVSYESLYAAKMLGCTKIILAGQDLAYANNQCYSSSSAYSELAFETNPETGKPEFKIKDYDKYIKSLLPAGTDISQPWCKPFAEYKLKNLNDTLIFVKGINGEMLPTQGCYAVFVEYFKEFAYFNQDLELINTSMIGAQIDGFKNMPIEKALENSTIVGKVEISHKHEYDNEKIIENLDKEKKMLTDILGKFSKAKEYMQKYEREFQRRRTITPEINKYFTSMLDIYNEITAKYYNPDPLYQIIAFNETIELQHTLKKVETVDTESIKLVFSHLKTYFINVEPKILHILCKIDTQRGIINESINSACK